jgi:hypothetical protein
MYSLDEKFIGNGLFIPDWEFNRVGIFPGDSQVLISWR